MGSMGVELLYKVVLHLVHRWNIKAGIKNCGEPDLGHASFSRLRELLRMAEKLGIKGSIPDIRLPPADYNPPELFGAMWQPDYLQAPAPAPASDVAPLPSAADQLENADDEDPIGLEALLEGSLSDLLAVDGPVEEFIANANRNASHWKKLTNVETPAEKELFVSFVGKMADSLASTGMDYTTMQDWWATKVNVEVERDPDMQIRPKSSHILKLYGEALMMERLFAANLEAISPTERVAAARSMRNITAPQPFMRVQPAPSQRTRAPAITIAASSDREEMIQMLEEGEEETAANDMEQQHEEGSMLDEGYQSPPGSEIHDEQEQQEQQLQQTPSAGPSSQPKPETVQHRPPSAPRQSQQLPSPAGPSQPEPSAVQLHPPLAAPRQSQQLPSSAGPSQPEPSSAVQPHPPLAAPRQSQQLPSSAGPLQREPTASPHPLAAPMQLQQLPVSAGPSQPEPVHHPPPARHMPPKQPFQGMYPAPLHAPPAGPGQQWYPHHYSAMPGFHPGYPAVPMAYHPYPPQAQHGMMFHHPQALSGAVPAAANAGTVPYAAGALPSRNPPAGGSRVTSRRGGAGTPKTCQTCFEKDGKRVLKKNHNCPHK